jgi:hypothetical protein
MNRCDVLLARFPHPSGGRGKKRPVVVVLTGLATGCQREPVRMKNMTLDTSRPADTRPMPVNPRHTKKVMPAEPNGPAPPPYRKP